MAIMIHGAMIRIGTILITPTPIIMVDGDIIGLTTTGMPQCRLFTRSISALVVEEAVTAIMTHGALLDDGVSCKIIRMLRDA
jgi:hypothetical protein